MLAVGSKTCVCPIAPSTQDTCSDCRGLGHSHSLYIHGREVFLQGVSELGEVTPLLLFHHVWENHHEPQMHYGPGVCSALTKPPSFGDCQIPRLLWGHVDGQRPFCTLVPEVASANIRTGEMDASGGHEERFGVMGGKGEKGRDMTCSLTSPTVGLNRGWLGRQSPSGILNSNYLKESHQE